MRPLQALAILLLTLLLASCGGGGSSSPVLAVSPASLVVNQLLGGPQSTARFSVRNSGGGTLTWNLAQRPSFVASISRSQGSLTGGQSAAVMLTFSCDEPGDLRGSVVIQDANGTSKSVAITVNCTIPPIDIEFSQSPNQGTGTPLTSPEAMLTWSFSSMWDGQGNVDYMIEASDDRVTITPATGTAEPRETVSVDLGFGCDVVDEFTTSIGVKAQDQTATVDWMVSCTSPPVDIAIETLADSRGTPLESANATLSWQFDSPWEGHGTEEFTIDSDDDAVTFEPNAGSVDAGETKGIAVTYNCTTLGAFEPNLNVRIGEQSASAAWNVECVAPPVTIVVESIELGVVGILPNPAGGVLRWSFSSEWDDHGVEQFEIQSADPLVMVASDQESAQPDETIEVQLLYACVVPVSKNVDISIVVGEESHAVEWGVICEAPPIELSVDDIDGSFALVGASANGYVYWSFSSPWSGQEPLEYTISVDDSRVSIEQATGMASLDEVVRSEIAFACGESGEFQVEWTVSIGGATVHKPWSIGCGEIEIDMSQPIPATAYFADNAESELIWSYSLNPVSDVLLNYIISFDDERVSVTPQNGTASPNEIYQNALLFSCNSIGENSVSIMLEIEGRQEQVDWVVDCLVPPIRIEVDPISNSSASVPNTASGTLRWSMDSPWPEQGPEEFTIQSDDGSASASPSSGTVALGETSVVDLTYQCSVVGSYSPNFTISVGGVQTTVTWMVQCSTAAITITIDSVPDATGLSDGLVAGSMFWSFTSSDPSQPPLEYFIRADSNEASANPSSGVATSDIRNVSQLQFQCGSADEHQITWTLQVGSEQTSTVWRVSCIDVTINATNPASSTAENGSTATGGLSWNWESSSENTTTLNYTIEDSNELASVSPSSGSASNDQTIQNSLAYECQSVGVKHIDFTIAVGDQESTVEWEVECTQPSPTIVITINDIADATAEVNENATSTLSWSYSSSSGNDTLSYQITSNNSSASASPSSGTATRDATNQSDLTFSCDSIENVSIVWTVSAGGTSSQMTWNVDCTASSTPILVDLLSTNFSSSGTPLNEPKNEFEWQLSSAPESSMTYTVEVDNTNANVEPLSGTVAIGETVYTELTYDCGLPEVVDVTWTLKIDTFEQEFEWHVECNRGVLRIGSVEIFQTPMIFKSVRDELTDGSVEYTKSKLLDVIEVRETVIGVKIEHEYQREDGIFSISEQGGNEVTATVGTDSPVALTVNDTAFVTSPLTSASGVHETTLIYPLGSDLLTDETVIDANLTDESSDGIDVPEIDFGDLTFVSTPAVSLKFFRIQNEEGTPEPLTDTDAEYFEGWGVAFLPITEASSTFSNDVIVPPDNPDGVHPCDYLDTLQDEWLLNGGATDFYYGTYIRLPDNTADGCALISENVAVGIVGNPIIYVHELGHNLSLYHTPCGVSGVLDPDYPFEDAKLGPNRGWHPQQFRFIYGDSIWRDVMSYCPPRFISAYSFDKALGYLTALSGQSISVAAAMRQNEHTSNANYYTALTEDGRPARSISVSGSIDEAGFWTTRMTRFSAREPLSPKADASHRVSLADSRGNEILVREIAISRTSHGKKLSWGTRLALPEQKPREIFIFSPEGNILLQEPLDL